MSVRAEFSEIPSLAGPLCPSGSLSANGLTQAQLDAGLLSEAGANDSEGVCEYLRRGANIEARDRFLATDGLHRRTPLMLAAVDNRLELAKLLVGNGASVNYQSGGPDLEREDGAGWSALMYAAGAGQVETATYLLDQGAEIDMQWASGYSALHEAAIWGRYKTVKLLIARGANVNLRDYALGGTPLHGASWGANSGHFTSTRPSSRVSWNKVIKALLGGGADVNARRDVDDRPPSYGGGASPLDSVVVANKSSRARKLRDAGGYCYVQISSLCAYPPVAVTVNFSSSGSGTVSAEGDGGVLSDGDNVRQGATVMFTATPVAGHYVSGWSGNCAEIGTVADGLDGTAKSCAVSADSDLSVRAEFSEIPSLAGPLCPSGSLSANGLTTTELNMTLRLAARGGDAARACEALRRGADVNDNLDNTEFTPLQEAVSGGHLDAAKLLLANGAEVNKRKGGTEHSPLDLAARDDEVEIAALLRDADGECFLETGPLCGSVPVATPDLVTVVNTVAATVASTVANTAAATAVAGFCPAGALDANGLTQAQLNLKLLDSARYDNLEGVCEYLRRGAEVNAVGVESMTPLLWATYGWADDEDVLMAELLLSRGADPNIPSNYGDSPLHNAADWPSAVMVSMLLASGAEVNAQHGGTGRSPLDYAAAYATTRDDNRDIAALLRAAGGLCFLETGPLCGNVPAATPDLVTVVNTVAATVANTVVATVAADELSCPAGSLPDNGLTQAGLDQGLLLAVSWWGTSRGGEMCEYLRRGANVNAKEGVGWTPLHNAAWHRQRGAAALLIQNSANIDPKSTVNETPLHVAANRNAEGVAALLLANGADVHAKSDMDDETPLHLAARSGAEEVAALLLANGADIHAKNSWSLREEETPLHVAAKERSEGVAALLLANGADVNAKTRWRKATPLHYAAGRGSAVIVSMLLAGDADVNAEDNMHRTPLHNAVDSRSHYWSWHDVTDGDREEVVALLLANGADVNAADSGETPMDIARRRGESAVLALLEAAANSPTVVSAPAPAEADALTDRLRERFAGAFNPSPAFGDAFGAVSGSSESFLTRLNSLMRSSAGAGGNAWDSFGGWQRENEHGRMWFSTGQRGDFGFGAGGNGAGGDLSASPFAALVGNGMLAGGETGLGSDGKLRIAAFADYQAKSLLDGNRPGVDKLGGARDGNRNGDDGSGALFGLVGKSDAGGDDGASSGRRRFGGCAAGGRCERVGFCAVRDGGEREFARPEFADGVCGVERRGEFVWQRLAPAGLGASGAQLGGVGRDVAQQ